MRFIILSVFMGLIVFAYSSRATLFNLPYNLGTSWNSGDFGHECHNLPGWMNDQAVSIHTHGTCVILCEHAHCAGRCEKFTPGSSNHLNLNERGFAFLGSSVKGC